MPQSVSVGGFLGSRRRSTTEKDLILEYKRNSSEMMASDISHARHLRFLYWVHLLEPILRYTCLDRNASLKSLPMSQNDRDL